MKSLLLDFVKMGMVLDRDERKEATSKEDQDPSRDLSDFRKEK